ncbi:YbaB/EbfC family nucleoid-associated protein [Phreatobacter cathodiphilus]|jgi:DNA-binding YbaB/EbfC family protein|uniref:Nucleoid-associated protein C6569_16535 n=1 Tax=Phreatobacter cathodiphilus TaxID=1868589 RepID=A0A2S0NEF2_9HYPH|nr:YbaB/EbfC family nucleoid-associated protein [Phreatobacter cathodiphilus]AVO46532.1 YbaB/EbfC family nucleoid-associated protein [Phreatobacter cathodiphilus]
MKDIMGLMKQAQAMQAKLQEAQADMERTEVQGTAGGGMVTVSLTVKGDLRSVSVDPSLLKPDEKEILEDLLLAAHADARRKAEVVAQEKMKGVTGGLPLPPGMKLPF